MTVPARLSIVTLGVGDVAAARAFYEALGWEARSSSMDEICWFDLGGCYLGLFERAALAADATVSDDGARGFGGFTLAMNLESEDSVRRALDAAAAAGATIVKPAARADWGGFSGYFSDADGHLWEVAHNPHFPIDEAGRTTIP